MASQKIDLKKKLGHTIDFQERERVLLPIRFEVNIYHSWI